MLGRALNRYGRWPSFADQAAQLHGRRRRCRAGWSRSGGRGGGRERRWSRPGCWRWRLHGLRRLLRWRGAAADQLAKLQSHPGWSLRLRRCWHGGRRSSLRIADQLAQLERDFGWRTAQNGGRLLGLGSRLSCSRRTGGLGGGLGWARRRLPASGLRCCLLSLRSGRSGRSRRSRLGRRGRGSTGLRRLPALPCLGVHALSVCRLGRFCAAGRHVDVHRPSLVRGLSEAW